MAEELEDLHSQAGALNNLGLLAYYEGNWNDAADFYARSSEAFHKSGNDIAAAYGEVNMAEILSEQGHLDEADASFTEFLPVFKSAGDLKLVAFVLNHQGRIEFRRGNIDVALPRFDEALEIYRSMGASSEQVEVTLRKAEALVLSGRVEAVLQMLDSRNRPEESPTQLRSLAHRVHGLTAWARGDQETGLAQLQAARTAARDVGSEAEEVASIHALAATGVVIPEWTDRAAELCEKLGIISVPLFRSFEPES